MNVRNSLKNKNARMLNQIFENSFNELYIFDAKSFEIAAVNNAARENIGYSKEELGGMTFLDFKPELDIEHFNKVLSQLSGGEQQNDFFYTVHQRKDGSLYPVKINLQFLDFGRKKLFLALAVDLTERSEMEEPVNKEELILDAIINLERDAMVMLNSMGNVILWNHAAENIFGYSKEEMLGENLHDKCAYKQFKYGFTDLKSVMINNNREKIIEAKARHKDGQELNIEISMSYIRTNDELYYIGILSDISERKRVQEELENSHKQCLELADNAPIGIVKCDIEGNIVYVNQKTSEILGSPDIKETKKINLLKFPMLIIYGLSRKLEECMQNNELGVYEMNYESIWGKAVCLRIHIKPLAEKNKVNGAHIIIDDITEKKHLEEELRLLSLTDSLTNLHNRRYFTQKLEEKIELVKSRDSSTFSLTMLDIDHFKNINDNFGHNTGDLVLKSLTEIIKGSIRSTDCLSRWGGEEFVILLQGTRLNEAVILVEKLRERISEMKYPGVDRVTASFGVVEYCAGDTVDSMIQKTDNLMYEAKKAGRNCVRSIKNTEKNKPLI